MPRTPTPKDGVCRWYPPSNGANDSEAEKHSRFTSDGQATSITSAVGSHFANAG